MKYFLDFGTHHFGGLEEFTQKLKIDKTFHVLCFEPNKEIYNKSRNNIDILTNYENKFLSFKHYNAAVMDYTGQITFNKHVGAWSNGNKDCYIDDWTCGSNCLDVNPSYDPGNGYVFDIITETCDCIDIEEVMCNVVNNDPNAEIYIKCDIEGSEFVVLPKLLSSQYIHNIKEIHIEWHERFWWGKEDYANKINEKNNIINRFNQLGISAYTHH